MKFMLITLVSLMSFTAAQADEPKSPSPMAERSGHKCEEKDEGACCQVSHVQPSGTVDPSAEENLDSSPERTIRQETRIFRNPRI